jgi:type IV secretory pathway VirB10-like protein
MVQVVLSQKKACGVAVSGLVMLFVVVACSTPDAAPKPAPTIPTIPTSSTSAQVSSTQVPSNNAITVRPAATPEPVAQTTTETPPPAPPPPPSSPPPVEETTEPTTAQRPERPFAQHGTECPVEGAIAVNRRLKPMVCTAEGSGKLRWQPI